MLNVLDIKNIALIDRLEAEFSDGLNILSGETGAGKSIIIDSLEFVLGERADRSLIRYGCDEASVSAIFRTKGGSPTEEILRENGIDCDDGEIMLSRTMTTDGKNVCRINGARVTLALLRQAARSLADIYGQHEATGLLAEENHISVLDKYAQKELSPLFAEQKKLCDEYYSVKKEMAKYGSLGNVEEKTEELQAALDELTEAALFEGEEEQLTAARKKFNNAQRIRDSLAEAAEALDGDGADALSSLAEAGRAVASVSDYDAAYAELEDRIESVRIETKDIAETLKGLLDSDDFDPYAAERCETRLAAIRRIMRKYGITESEYADKIREIENDIAFYANGEFALIQLEERAAEAAAALAKNTAAIHTARETAAEKLAAEITSELKDLGMNNASFRADVVRKNAEPHENGDDRVTFMFSANAGQPLRELSKVISGGELSRFMLAVKNIISDIDGVDTMVFDEIDTGISGKTSQVVTEKLYSISKGRQVLAVTHLPQLAAMADRHFLIAKSTDGSGTRTSLVPLDGGGMLEEIARLIGGKEYSSHALPHAKEMKDHAEEFKKSV